MPNRRFNKQVPGHGYKRGGQVKSKSKSKSKSKGHPSKYEVDKMAGVGEMVRGWLDHKKDTQQREVLNPKRKGAAYGGRINTGRENRLEELGRVDAERAGTGRGRRNLSDEKKRIIREIRSAKPKTKAARGEYR